ncbi:MAG: glutathione S-transferase family protein [Hyphomicrobiales bacterium]
MKLHHNPASPFVRMALVTAIELGLQDEIELLDTGTFLPIERHHGVAGDNPLGRIPALVTKSGQTIYDSRVICEYFDAIAGENSLYPTETEARFRVLTLQALAQGLCDTAVNLRYETFLRPKEKRWDTWIDRQQARIDEALNDIEENWAGELKEVTVGSIGVAVALAYLDFRYPNLGWRTNRPTSAEFLEEFEQRASMKSTVTPDA